jgi:hypothetical protein
MLYHLLDKSPCSHKIAIGVYRYLLVRLKGVPGKLIYTQRSSSRYQTSIRFVGYNRPVLIENLIFKIVQTKTS